MDENEMPEWELNPNRWEGGQALAPFSAMCRADLLNEKPTATVPSYNERLAFGTDQGRWLAEQVDMTECSAKQRPSRSSRPQRVYHELESTNEASRSLPQPARGEESMSWLPLLGGVAAFFIVLVLLFVILRM